MAPARAAAPAGVHWLGVTSSTATRPPTAGWRQPARSRAAIVPAPAPARSRPLTLPTVRAADQRGSGTIGACRSVPPPTASWTAWAASRGR